MPGLWAVHPRRPATVAGISTGCSSCPAGSAERVKIMANPPQPCEPVDLLRSEFWKPARDILGLPAFDPKLPGTAPGLEFPAFDQDAAVERYGPEAVRDGLKVLKAAGAIEDLSCDVPGKGLLDILVLVPVVAKDFLDQHKQQPAEDQGGDDHPHTQEPESLILRVVRELEEAIRAYACDNEPNRELWAVLINRLWQADRELNPKRLRYGAAGRDEHFRALPLLQSGPLSRIRIVVDKGICTFGLEGVIGPESLEGVLAMARKVAAEAGYRAPRVDGDWANQLHSAAAALTTEDATDAPRKLDEFLKALDSFIAVLSRKAKDVDQWVVDVTEAAEVLNSRLWDLARDGVPIEGGWIDYGLFLDFFKGWIRPLYLNWTGQGKPAPYPTPPEILKKLQTFADGFAGRKSKRQTEAAELSPEDATIPNPDDKLVRQMKGNSRCLLLHLWKRGNVSLDELRAVLWSEHRKTNTKAKRPTSKAATNAVDYLERKLQAAAYKNTLIEKNGGMYFLRHPQK